MPWVIAAAAVGSALLGANAAKKASAEQSRATDAAIAEEARQYDQTRMDTAPNRAAGQQAVGRIGTMMGLGSPAYSKANPSELQAMIASLEQQKAANRDQFGAYDPVFDQEIASAKEALQGGGDFGAFNKKFSVADFESDPVTQVSLKYGLDLGTKAIDRGAGAAGLRNSGATMKALTRFGQDYAGSKASESYGRFYGDQDRIFNRLSGLAGTGQTATMGTAALGGQSAQNVGNLLTAGANARGAAAIGTANAYGGALNTVGSYYAQKQMLDKILKARGGTA